MSDFVAGRPPGAHNGPPGRRNGGSMLLVLLAALAVALLIGVTLMALLLIRGGGNGAAPASPASATSASADERVLLAVSFEGDGKGQIRIAPGAISCSRACEHRFAAGTRVTVKAAAASGSTFEGWDDACDGADRCSFVIDEDRSLSVTFEDADDDAGTRACGEDLAGELDPACADETGDDVLRSDCFDGRDNDRDGLTDAAQDPSCDEGKLEAGRAPAASAAPVAPVAPANCADGRDNDGDGLTDTKQDPDCLTGDTETETSATDSTTRRRSPSDCRDGRDNDGDGLIDSAQDPGCEEDGTEAD